MVFSGSEWLFWGGIGIMALSALSGVFCLVLFLITGRILKKKKKKSLKRIMGNYSVRACTDVIFDHALRQIYGG